jgi:hypothetical protein
MKIKVLKTASSRKPSAYCEVVMDDPPMMPKK